MTSQNPVPIAIVGIGCRLPAGVTNTTELWKLLVEGRNVWSAVPADRYNEAAFYHPNPDNKGTTNHRGGHFISQDVAAFDAGFFNISPIEAQAMDPQQRLLLETSYEAFENAGIPIEKVRGSNTAVYTAMFTRDYDRNIYKDPSDVPKYHVTGSGEAIVSNRISYAFDLKGPSMTLDTGCSGSMVALHQACQSLRTGESSMALASGVNLILNPDHMFGMSNLHMLNTDGKSYSFDARGSGYGRGEGVATVLLKRLDDALRAGDHIRAIIRNTAVNQDGKTNGITLPSQKAQESLQRSIFERADLNPRNVQYVEAHGTGTVAGDLAELQGIANVFCEKRHSLDSLYVGSIKSNIGHLESTSGLAGLIKTVLILEKGLIPPNADFQTEKSNLKLQDWGIKVPSKLEPWPGSGVRQASVNSFGYGGTNAHVILESTSASIPAETTREAQDVHYHKNNYSKSHGLQSTEEPKVAINTSIQAEGNGGELGNNSGMTYNTPLTNPYESDAKRNEVHQSLVSVRTFVPRLFVMSARSEKSLNEILKKLRDWLITRHESERSLQDLAYTLSSRRSMMEWRYSIIAASQQGLIDSLNSKVLRGTKISSNLCVGFVYTGQGAQWFAMGRALIFTHSQFTNSLVRSDAILREFGASWSLIDELLLDKSSSRINQSEIAQPASTALQIAIVDLLDNIGIRPQVVLGHSSGEIAAAYAAGILSQTAALKVAYCRSFISSYCNKKSLKKGGMLAVGLCEDRVLALIAETQKGVVSVACVNSSSSTIISGDETAILEIEETLKQLGVSSRRLKVDTAYHSHHMQQVASEYLSSMSDMHTQTMRNNVKYISSVTAAEKTSGFGPAYWVKNLVSKVRFYDALCYQLASWQLMMPQTTHVLIEIGPHSVFAGPIRQTVAQRFDMLKCVYLPTLVRDRDAVHGVSEMAGKMFQLGYPVNLAAAHLLNGSHHQFLVRHDLPTYPWDHSNTYWHESRLSQEYRLRRHPCHDLLGVRISTSSSLEPSWRHIISIESLPWLAEHVVDDLVIFPGAGYMCMAIEAIRQLTHDSLPASEILQFVLKDVRFSKALIVPPAPSKVEIHLSLRTRRNGKIIWYKFQVSAISQDKVWHEHCSGLVKVDLASQISFVSQGDQLSLDQDILLAKEKLNNTETAECSEKLLSKDLYNRLRSNGNHYGPCFAAVEELEVNNFWAIGRVSVPDAQSTMPSKYMQPHIIHPTTLDSLMHASLPLYTRNYGAGSIMPVFIGGVNVSPGISNSPGKKLIVAATLSPNGTRSARIDTDVFKTDGEKKQELVLKISQMNIRGFGTTPIDELDSTIALNMSFKLKWDADIEYLPRKNDPSSRTLSLDDYFKHLRFKRSQMKVLQVGAGIGEVTFPILRALSDNEIIPIERYDFTDVSPVFFRQARELLQDWNNLIHFKTLDIEKGLIGHEFAIHTYDLIISASPLYAVGYSETALANFHKLLKPGGRLLHFKEYNSVVTEESLHESLLHHSFNGVELFINDIQGITEDTVIVSKAISTAQQDPTQFIEIITTEGTKGFASSIAVALESQGFETSLATWSKDLSKSQKIYLIVDNGRNPLLVNPSPEQFKQMTTLVSATSNIFWVSAHEDSSATMNPEKGLVVGLARSARAENYHLKFITFDVQEVISSCLPELLDIIKDIVLTSFSNAENQLEETEYAYRNGQVVIPRLISDTKINAWMTGGTGKSTVVESTSYGQYSRPLKLFMPDSGSKESAYVIDDESIRVPLGPLTVEIDIKVHGLNPGDFVNSSDQSGFSSMLVREFAGIVITVGSEADKIFCVGDRICGWSYDGVPYANHVRVNVQNISRLPDLMSLENGAAIPISFMSAYHGLMEIADLQRGQTILIHGAARAMGEAALVIARHIGADFLAIVSNFAEEEYLVTRLGVSHSQIFSEEAPNFTERIFQITQGSGVDVVFDPYASELFSESWATLASLGSYIRIRQLKDHRNGETNPPVLTKNATFVSFDLATLISCRPQKVATLLKKVMSIFETGAYQPNQRITTISVAKIEDASGLIQAQKYIGKVVLEAIKDIEVKVLNNREVLIPKNQSQLDETGTYVIAGGLGDLGQKLCHLMASRGAKYIVLLSRRTLDNDRRKVLQDDLRLISPGLEVYSMACDISDSSMVYDVVSSFTKMGLPPVKGVVQSATVLQDCVLESMTSSDFQVPLQTKLYGTRHLSEAFQNSPLDFFIMLSSLSGVIGTKAQANYAAGNTFQDSFSHSQMNSKTHYITLNLGMIEGTAVYERSEGRARSQNLLVQGFIPVKHKELLIFLDYAMSSQARADQCKQAIIGIDGRSIEEAEDATPTTKSAMFIHVRSAYNSKMRSASGSSVENRKKTLADAYSLSQVHQIINTAVVQKLSNLIALEQDKIHVESPLSDFGIDSLNAIQLKNWIGQEFHAPIQTSEILDESSITALSKRVASRSTLVQEYSKDTLGQEDKSNDKIKHDVEVANISLKPLLNGVQHNSNQSIVLPQLPLAELQSTLELYLISARSFLSEDRLKHTSTVIGEFGKGVGTQLQERLMHRKNDPQIDNWQYDLHVNYIYLNRRDPVYPYGIFYGSHLLTETPHTQAERAAIISTATYEFKRRMDAGELKQEYMNEDPICMNSLQWLFNTNRMPCVGRDNICKYPGNDYLVALRRGHVFKIVLISKGKPVSYEDLRASFRAILHSSEERLTSVATLTADERDSWAGLRTTLRTINQANDELVQIIEAAAFIVCLDDGSPSTPTERCNQFLLGDPSNRWSDKSLQFVVCENGTSSFICEHSMLDAMSVKQMNKFISQTILEHKPEAQYNDTVKFVANLAEQYTFTTNAAIEIHIFRVQQHFRETHSPAELNHFHISALGNSYFHANKISSKAGFQLIIQLASLMHFGQQWPSWETLTTMLFHKGRLDWIQVVSPAMFEFCKAAIDKDTPVPKRQMLLHQAAKTHTSTMTRISRGKGFMAHLEALQEVLREGEPVPAFFQDPTWEMMRVTSARKIKTDASEGLMAQEAGFLMPDPESVLVHYELEDLGCRLYIQSTETRTGAFFEALQQAADMVKDLLEM